MRVSRLSVRVSVLLVFLVLFLRVAPATADEFVYVVQAGDTLYSIARRYSATVAEIMRANGLASYTIHVGQSLVISAGVEPTPAPSPAGDGIYYTVMGGDTLFRISRRFGVSSVLVAQANGIVNPALIFPGQQLFIPGVQEPSPSPSPPPTPEPGEGFYYSVQVGDTLFRIAARFGTTVSLIISSNDLANPNLIAVGQQLWIPGQAGPAPAPPSPSPSPPTSPAAGFGYGIQVHLPGQDMNQVLGAVNDLGLSWVKQQIEWKVFEPAPGQIQWSELDAMVNAADAHGLRLLFSVVKAPAWSRSTSEEDGPPLSFHDYWTFVGALATRYAGRVDAYEIWNEQNLRREWNGQPLSASRYVELLAGAYNAVKAADPGAVVVSGAPAPTGWNDGVTAIDDRVYLDAMYAAGLKNNSDAIGAHPNGWANHASLYCCRQEPDVPSHNDHPSFFFRHTIEDYWNIMVRWGDQGARLWATEFGWGSLDGLAGGAQPGYEFVAYNSEADQADYLTQAFSLARSGGYVGAMFAWNLNFCPVAGPGAEQCYWGIVRPDWSPRDAYGALKGMPKP